MSDEIPFEIQSEIIKKVVSIKSLLRFRSVSKQWKSLIDSSEFITHHTLNNQTHTHHILVSYHDHNSECKYVSFVGDDSFPQHQFSPFVSPTVNPIEYPYALASSHGLVFVLQSSKLIAVWNPSIRKSVVIELPCESDLVGFGFCPKTFEPKIVKITSIDNANTNTNTDDYKAEVLTLSSMVWRSISTNLLSMFRKRIKFPEEQVVIDGVIYWLARLRGEREADCYRIISFDFTSEEFGDIHLPDCLPGSKELDICKLNASLVVLDYRRADDAVCDVWMMLENGARFTKLFTVVNTSLYCIIGFRKNGQPLTRDLPRIMPTLTQLEVYEPGLQHKNGLGIYGWGFT